MYGLIRDRDTETHFVPVLEELNIVENTVNLLLYHACLVSFGARTPRSIFGK